jgi:hypothetical protein
MKKDDILGKTFADFRPELGSGEEFMSRLADQLDKVEMARQYYQSERKLMRKKYLIAFTAGLVSGGAMALVLLLHPISVTYILHFLPQFMLDSAAKSIAPLLSVVIVIAVGAAFASICVEFYTLLTHKSHPWDY